jgi:FlaG/FlaF family flagellin (archaellin)
MQWRAPCILEHQACDRAFAGVAKTVMLIAIATVLAARINFSI